MSYFEDDYFDGQSEAEEIINEATDKLIGLISEKTKSEIERYKKLVHICARNEQGPAEGSL